jgi:hypothetical protein
MDRVISVVAVSRSASAPPFKIVAIAVIVGTGQTARVPRAIRIIAVQIAVAVIILVVITDFHGTRVD